VRQLVDVANTQQALLQANEKLYKWDSKTTRQNLGPSTVDTAGLEEYQQNDPR